MARGPTASEREAFGCRARGCAALELQVHAVRPGLVLLDDAHVRPGPRANLLRHGIELPGLLLRLSGITLPEVNGLALLPVRALLVPAHVHVAFGADVAGLVLVAPVLVGGAAA